MHTTRNSTATAGLAGLLLGAGITATAFALRDRKTRERVVNGFREAKHQAEKAFHDTSRKSDEILTDAKDSIDESREAVEDFKESTEPTTKKF